MRTRTAIQQVKKSGGALIARRKNLGPSFHYISLENWFFWAAETITELVDYFGEHNDWELINA